MSESREIYRSSNIVMTIAEDNDKVQIKRAWYPLKGYGNRVEKIIEFIRSESKILAIQCNYSWDGTGCKELAFVRFSDNEFAELLNTARSIKSVEDFNYLLEKLREIEEEADNEVDSKIREIIEKLQQIQQLKDILSNIEKKELINEIKEYLLERFSE